MSAEPLPGQSEQPAEIMCPSCGRFVGALTRCPHCGSRVAKRLSVRLLRYAALGLATVGLGLLYLMTTHRELPLVRVADIKPTMNFAYVRVAGTVSLDARMFKEGGKVRSMRFAVDDGTGEISVTAYRAQAEALVRNNMIPRAGDRIEVAGALSMTANDDVVMRLQLPEHLSLTRAEMPVTGLGDVTPGMVGTSLLVEGTIAKVQAPKPGSKAPWAVTIRDDTGQRELTFWEDVYAELTDKILLAPGTAVRARVSVRTYRDQLQLSLNRGADLEFPGAMAPAGMTAGPGAPAPARDAKAVAIADITADMAGQVVKVAGRVAEFRAPAEGTKAPYEVVLKDGDRSVTVVYWDTVARHLDNNQPVVGALVTVRGQVGVYREKIQLKVNHSDQITVEDVAPAAAPPTAAPGGEVKIATITKAMQGRTCTVRGTLGEPKSIKNGVIFPLADDSGTIKLVLWDREVPERDAYRAGVRVTATGEVKEYRGDLEIIPASAQAVRVEAGAGE